MRTRGPESKPTALHVLLGERADLINNDEPLPAEGALAAPDRLSGARRSKRRAGTGPHR